MKKLAVLALSMGLAFSMPIAAGATTVDPSPDEAFDDDDNGGDDDENFDEDDNGGDEDENFEDEETVVVVVKGQFTYEDGTPAKGLTVKLKNQKVTTDSKGNYSFKGIKPGTYTLTVSKGDAKYTTVKVKVSKDGVKFLSTKDNSKVFSSQNSTVEQDGNKTSITVIVDGVITADMIDNATDESTSPKTGDTTKAAGAAFVVVVAGVALFFTGRRYKKA